MDFANAQLDIYTNKVHVKNVHFYVLAAGV